MERQLLVFLHGPDEGELIEKVSAVEPGLVLLRGKFAPTGDATALLADPERYPLLPALRSQRRLYLAHRTATTLLTLHLQPEGPHRGLYAIDERRSEILELALAEPAHGRLAPARLSAGLFAAEGMEAGKKSGAFVRWVNRVLRALERDYPPSSIDFVRVGKGARAFAAAGGQLTYLEEPVLPDPVAGGGQRHKERL